MVLNQLPFFSCLWVTRVVLGTVAPRVLSAAAGEMVSIAAYIPRRQSRDAANGRRFASRHSLRHSHATALKRILRDKSRIALCGALSRPNMPGNGHPVAAAAREDRLTTAMDATPKVRFALDSALEGDGFELPVPREKKSRNLGIPLEFN